MIPGLSDRIPIKNKGRALKQLGAFMIPPGGDWQMVPVSFVESYGYDRDLVFDFSGFRQHMATRDDTGRFTFDWWCPLSMVDGYGRHALAIYKGFSRSECEPILHDVDWIDKSYLPGEIEAARHMGMYRMPNKIGCVMSLPYDQHIHNHQSVTRVVVTQFETNKIPEKHISNVNIADHLILTSSWQPKVWKKCGINIPISVMTPGVDTDFFAYKQRHRDGIFRVLLLGAITGRKNPLGAIRIFRAASEGRSNWRFVIKTRKTDAIDNIRRAIANDPRMSLEVEDSHPDIVLKYYHGNDCLLWPSKGEGVGLPPLEAMATGMELVCSDNSGMSDYVHDAICYPIRTSHMESASGADGFSREYIDAFGDVGDWWVPDEHHAVAQLQKCYQAWSDGRGKGTIAAEYVRQHHTLRLQSESILKVLKQYE